MRRRDFLAAGGASLVLGCSRREPPSDPPRVAVAPSASVAEPEPQAPIPRELDAEPIGEPEVTEGLGDLRQTELRVRREADLEAEERGDDPETDALSLHGSDSMKRRKNRLLRNC